MQHAKSLLDQFLGQVQTGAAPVASGTPAPQQQAGQGGFNLQDVLTGKGGLATGALAGGLAGLLLGGKKPRKLAASALKVGGIAVVGGLAYKAWNDWQNNKAAGQPAPAQPPADTSLSGTPFLPAASSEQEDLSLVLIRAMISAAKADGHVTDQERRAISTQLATLGLDGQHRAFIEEELSKPLDISAVADSARSPEQAAEIYAASLLVIDPSGAAERGYLAMLAARLGLEQGLVEHLHAGVDGMTERQVA